LFFERPSSGEKALLVHLDLETENEPDDPREFEELVLSAGGDPVDFVTANRKAPDPKYFVGKGKLEELKVRVHEHCAEIVIFNHSLSPSQQRNLETFLECRVLDRTGLILDIFAQRARTYEGKLQVELAQLDFMATRLVRGWTHLERQKGGIGMRGPGETQLETDRRLIRDRISALQKRLEKVRRQRDQGRRSRQRAEIATVSLVGYTNAGKSTLFNRLTSSDVLVEDKLFATLDPTMRRVEIADVGSVILADTVGFISHLPHKLVEAFSATLEEAASATLLLHVMDAHSENRQRNMDSVSEVLHEIGAADNPQLLVYNKIDLLEHTEPHIDRDGNGRPVAVWLSAASGVGIELLIDAIRELLSADMFSDTLHVPSALGRLRARFFALNAVQSECIAANGSAELKIRMPRADFNRLLKTEGVSLEELKAFDPPESRETA
jgi:GTP-binding protein HflX